MIKELSTVQEEIRCDVCERTILKGERTEKYLASGGHKVVVCELCMPRAERAGWVRESASADLPARRESGRKERRGIRARFGGGGRTEEEADRELTAAAEHRPDPEEVERALIEDTAQRQPPTMFGGRNGKSSKKSPRPVRAVPTDSRIKLGRSVEIFNESEHRHTVAGLTRTLGEPQVSVVESPDTNHEVLIAVAWELSWYQYVVDLSIGEDPVRLECKGDEVEELGEAVRKWNASAEQDGQLKVTSGVEQ